MTVFTATAGATGSATVLPFAKKQVSAILAGVFNTGVWRDESLWDDTHLWKDS